MTATRIVMQSVPYMKCKRLHERGLLKHDLYYSFGKIIILWILEKLAV